MKTILPKSLLKNSPPKLSKSKSGKTSINANKFNEMQLITDDKISSKLSREIPSKINDKSSNKSILSDEGCNQHQIKVIVRFRPYIESEKVILFKLEKRRKMHNN
jgi:hypothetical protein